MLNRQHFGLPQPGYARLVVSLNLGFLMLSSPCICRHEITHPRLGVALSLAFLMKKWVIVSFGQIQKLDTPWLPDSCLLHSTLAILIDPCGAWLGLLHSKDPRPAMSDFVGPPLPFLLCSSGMFVKYLLQNRGGMPCRGISLPPRSFLHIVARILLERRWRVAVLPNIVKNGQIGALIFPYEFLLQIVSFVTSDGPLYTPPFLATGSLAIP